MTLASGGIREEGQLDSILDSSDNIVVVLDGIGKITRISRGVKTILGYSDQDITGSTIMTMVPMDRRDWMSAISKRAREDGVVSDVFIHWKTRDGRRLITKSTLRSVVNYQHDVVGMIISEDAAKPAALEGVMTPDQAMDLIHASEISMVVTDLSGNILSFSSGAEKLTGLASSQVVGSTIGRLFIERSVIGEITTKGLRDGKVEDFETQMIMSDDQKKEISVSLSVRRNPSGAATGFSIVMFDISRRKELERELELRAEKLKLVNELATRIRSGKSMSEIYSVAQEGLKRMVQFDTMTLVICGVTEDEMKIGSVEGKQLSWLPEGASITLRKGPFGKALESGSPIVYAYSDLKEAIGSDLVGVSDFAIGLIIPLFAGERILGLLNFTSSIPLAFGQKEIDLMVLVADHIALAAESTRLFNALMENINIQTILMETSTAVRSEMNLKDVFRTTVLRAQEIVSSNRVALYMLENDQLRLVAGDCPENESFQEIIAKDDKNMISAHFFGSGKALIKDVMRCENASEKEKAIYGSVMMAKLMGRAAPMGMIFAARAKAGTQFNPYEFELLSLFINHLSPSIENAQLFEDTRHSEVMARKALESERRTQEALHFIVDMFAHDSQNQIQGILGYLELISQSDIPAEAQSYIEKAMRQVKAGSYLISGTANVFKNIETGKTAKTSDDIIHALQDAMHRFSAVFSNVEIESQIPFLDSKEIDSDPLLSELFFHIIRFMQRASHSPGIEVTLLNMQDSTKAKIEFKVAKGKGLSSGKILKSLENSDDAGYCSTSFMDPFIVRLLSEVYGAGITTSEAVSKDGSPELICELEFDMDGESKEDD